MSVGTIIVIVIIIIAAITVLVPISLVGKTIWNNKKNLFQREGVQQPLNYFANNEGPLDNPPVAIPNTDSNSIDQSNITPLTTSDSQPFIQETNITNNKDLPNAIEPNLDNSFKSKANPIIQPQLTKENVNLHYQHESGVLIESNKIKAISQPKFKKYRVKTKRHPLHNRLLWWKFDDMETGKNDGVDDINRDFANKKIDDYNLSDFEFTKFDDVKGNSIKDDKSVKKTKPKKAKKNHLKNLKIKILQHHPTEQPMEEMKEISSIKDISNQEMIKINLISKIVQKAIIKKPKKSSAKKAIKKVAKKTITVAKKLKTKKPKATPVKKSKVVTKKPKQVTKKIKRVIKKVSVPGSKGKKVF